jgi:hypothetical protein
MLTSVSQTTIRSSMREHRGLNVMSSLSFLLGQSCEISLHVFEFAHIVWRHAYADN